MSIQISKTKNDNKKFSSFFKDNMIQHPFIISHESIFSTPEEAQVIPVPSEMKIKSKRGRKKKNPDPVEVPTLKKFKIEQKSIQKEAEYFNTVYLHNEAQYREMQEKALSMINFHESKEKNIEPTANDSEVSMIISNNQMIKQEYQNNPHTISRFLYPNCVNKSYNHFYGYFGHTTVLTTRPIIEGTYFIEIKILLHSINKLNKVWYETLNKNFKKYQQDFKTAIRVGIAKKDYNLLTPLGGESSYALKGIDGLIINNRKTINKTDIKFGIGDTIGILLHMEAPLPTKKNQKKNELKEVVNTGSRLSFYKNGTKITQIVDLIQQYYVFGVSMYNWANIQINQGPKFQFPPSINYKPYTAIYSQTVDYKDIKFV